MSYQLGGEEAVPFSAHGADYVIRKSGSVYLAEGRLGNQDLHNTSLVTLWDAIYGEVASPTMQFTRGDFTVDGTLSIQAQETKVYGMGPGATNFVAINGLDDAVFDWEGDNFYWDVEFRDFRISGNKDNQAGASRRGIDASQTTCTLPGGETYRAALTVDNVHVRDCKGAGFWWWSNAGVHTIVKINNSKFVGNGDAAGETVDMIMERFSDGTFVGNEAEALRVLVGSSTNTWIGNYWGGGGEQKVVEYSGSIVGFPAKGNKHVGDFFDNPNNAGNADSGCLSIEGYAWNNHFLSCAFGRNTAASTANTAAQVQVIDDASHNRFLGCAWFHPSDLTKTFRYAIWEKDNADYNVYSGSISRLDRPGSGLSVYGTGYWNVNSNSDVDGLRVI